MSGPKHLVVSPETHHRVHAMRWNGRYRNVGEVVEALLQEHDAALAHKAEGS